MDASRLYWLSSVRAGVKSMNMGSVPAPSSEEKQSLSTKNFPGRCLRFGTFQLDLQRQELWKDGRRIKVQGKVYQALVALLENPGEIVTREVLRKRIWPRDAGLNYDANVNTTVNKLRGVLGDTNEESIYIETIPRQGYSFIAKVEYLDEPIIHAVPVPQSGVRLGWEKSFLRRVDASGFFGPDRARIWFTAGVIALMIAAMLFGAAITLYSRHRPL
jgi:DNA-binding winged helix-turn-helix (wHTH) protein